MGKNELVEKAMIKLSAAARLPVKVAEDKDIDAGAQFAKAERSVAAALGLHSFRVNRPPVARGPWVRRLFSTKPEITTTKGVPQGIPSARRELRAEVEKLMVAEREKQIRLKQQLRELLNK